MTTSTFPTARPSRPAHSPASEPTVPTDDAHGPEAWVFEVFYDGDCPLCRREIAMLRRWDKRNTIRFTDLADPAFAPAVVVDRGKPLTRERLMETIHGRLPDGTIVTGVEVFRQLYGAVGWAWLMPATRWPGVRHTLDGLYTVFAKNRLRVTGRRCTDQSCTP